jgi:pimeloyl-ACP methyl ester carboxylesterase
MERPKPTPWHGPRELCRAARAIGLGLLIGLGGAAVAAAEPSRPAALYEDPPIDAAHPASGAGVTFISRGAQINAQVYQPAGEGPHPTVILLHGLPGNEQNLDLARAIQRAGWTVITFHYRGSWGSGGAFSLTGGCEDVEALLSRLRAPATAREWGVDPARLAIIGHSYGGFVAACAAAAHPDLMGVGLIAPWDPSYDARAWRRLSPVEARKAAAAALSDVNGRLGAVDDRAVMRQILDGKDRLDLARFGPSLATRRVLILTAKRDDPDDQALGLLAAMKPSGSGLTARMFDTDHGFNDHRIALARDVLEWLAKMPGAPSERRPGD